MQTDNYLYGDFLVEIDLPDFEEWKQAFIRDKSNEDPELEWGTLSEDQFQSYYQDELDWLIGRTVVELQESVNVKKKFGDGYVGFIWGSRDNGSDRFYTRQYGGEIVAEQRYYHQLPALEVDGVFLPDVEIYVYYVLRNGYYHGANIDVIVEIEFDGETDYSELPSIYELNLRINEKIDGWVTKQVSYLDDPYGELESEIWGEVGRFMLPDFEQHTLNMVRKTISQVSNIKYCI